MLFCDNCLSIGAQFDLCGKHEILCFCKVPEKILKKLNQGNLIKKDVSLLIQHSVGP